MDNLAKSVVCKLYHIVHAKKRLLLYTMGIWCAPALVVGVPHAVRLLHQVDWQQDAAPDDVDILEDPADDTPDPSSPAPFALSASKPPPEPSAPAANLQPSVKTGGSSRQVPRVGHSPSEHSDDNKGAKAVPMGEVVAVVGRSNQDIVVSLAEEDQKAIQQRQQTNRSVRLPC